MKPPSWLPFIVIGLFGFFFVLERFFPLRSNRSAVLVRVLVNLAVSAFAFLIALLTVRPSALHTLNWASQTSFGLLHWFPLPVWANLIVGFLLLDLSFYYWHVANHKIPLLWRFHNVHHIDPDLDVSTGFRFHFGEVLFSTIFRVLQVALIGVPFFVFVAYELIFQANTLFHHSNLRLPIAVERVLNVILVTPRMHGIHHSQVRPETNSNFGVVFSWWDKLHRTIGLNIPQSELEIGVPGYSLIEDNRFWSVLTVPFRRQRDYWRKPDGSLPLREAVLAKGNRSKMAE